MRFTDFGIPLLALLIVADWVVGHKPESIEDLQIAVSILIMAMFLLEVVPRWIRKLHPGDVKRFLGILPVIAFILVIGYTMPDTDVHILEILAVVMFVLNLLTLNIVKRKLAKRLAAHSNKAESLKTEISQKE